MLTDEIIDACVCVCEDVGVGVWRRLGEGQD